MASYLDYIKNLSATDWMFVSSQNSCVKILIPNAMVLGDGDFGR